MRLTVKICQFLRLMDKSFGHLTANGSVHWDHLYVLEELGWKRRNFHEFFFLPFFSFIDIFSVRLSLKYLSFQLYSRHIITSRSVDIFFLGAYNPFNRKRDQHLISPYNNIAKSYIKVMRIQRMITSYTNFSSWVPKDRVEYGEDGDWC